MTVETFVVVTTGCATGITWVGPWVRRNNPQRSGRPRAENHPPKVPVRPGVRAPSPHRVGGRQKPRRPGPERWRVNTGSHWTLVAQLPPLSLHSQPSPVLVGDMELPHGCLEK